MSTAKAFSAFARATMCAEQKSQLPFYLDQFGAQDLSRAMQVKAAVDPSGVSNIEYLDPARAMFIESLRHDGVFYALLGLFRPVGLRTACRVISAAASAAVVGEAQGIGLTQISTVDVKPAPQKAVGAVILSRELAVAAGEAAARLFDRELRGAISAATDRHLVDYLESIVTPRASWGSSANAAVRDIAGLLNEIDVPGPVVLIAGDDVAKQMSTLQGSGGNLLFPEMGPSGGTVCGMTTYVTDAARSKLIALNPSGFVAGVETLELMRLQQSQIQLNTVSDSPPTATTVMVSLFQQGLLGLIATQFFVLGKIKDGVCAVTTGVEYFPADSGNSPA